MSAHFTASPDAQVAARPPIGGIFDSSQRGARLAFGTIYHNSVRLAGRAAVAMPPSTWLLLDMVLIGASVCAAYDWLPPPASTTTPTIVLWQAAPVFAFAVFIATLIFGSYERETLTGRSRILARMFITTLCAAAIAYAIVYVVMYSTISRRTAALALVLFLASACLIRVAALWAIQRVHRGLLVVGPRALFESFQNAQAEGLLHEYQLRGYVSAATGSAQTKGDSQYLGRVIDRLPSLARDGITNIVVSDEAARDPRVMEWMVPCLQAGCRVTNQAIFHEKATGQILVDEITPHWFLFADLKAHCDEHAMLKRVFDLGAAGVGLLLSLPLWPVIALAIKLCDGGPVFYSQDRVGQHGRIFRLFKFRTMRQDAENGKSVWSAPNDPRVTRVGVLLRRARLDELPQLYNILMGHMSLVGPRPERPDIVEELREKLPYYAERHLVKPGLTGWAQISFRYGSTIEDAKRKLQFDLFYLKHMSFEMDVIILFRTVGTFLRGGC